MARFLELCLLASLLVAWASASASDNRVEEDSSSLDADDDNEQPENVDFEVGELPSLLGMRGSKVPVAENVYDEYSADEDEDDTTDDDEDDTTDDDDVESEPPTAPCCFPNVWQGRVKSDFGFAPLGGGRGGDKFNGDKKGKKQKGPEKKKGGKPTSARAIDLVYVDGANHRIAGNKTVFGDQPGKNLNFSYIVLLGANKTADLYVFNSYVKKCRHSKLANIEWHQQCLPANATMRGQFPLGPSAGGLIVQSWAIEPGQKRIGASVVSQYYGIDNVDDSSEDEDVSATTTKRPPRPKPRPRVVAGANVLIEPRTCTPVVIQEEGAVIVGGGPDAFDFSFDGKKPKPSKAGGTAFIGSVYFSDVKTSISDTSVFNPPSYCNATHTTLFFDNMEDELPPALERFLML